MTFINKINRKLHTLSEIRESKYVLKQIANYLLNLMYIYSMYNFQKVIKLRDLQNLNKSV